VRHRPGCCDRCGAGLAGRPVTGVERREVFDLPEVAVTVTGHQLIERECRCGRRTKGMAPEGAEAPVQYGARTGRYTLLMVHPNCGREAIEAMGVLPWFAGRPDPPVPLRGPGRRPPVLRDTQLPIYRGQAGPQLLRHPRRSSKTGPGYPPPPDQPADPAAALRAKAGRHGIRADLGESGLVVPRSDGPGGGGGVCGAILSRVG
jgi:zinc-finger binding domain of transposase IS66